MWQVQAGIHMLFRLANEAACLFTFVAEKVAVEALVVARICQALDFVVENA